MLQHARAGQRALLGDVADEQHADPVGLGDPHDLGGDFPDLGDAARRAAQLIAVEGLDRVDDADLGLLLFKGREDGVKVCLGDHRDVQGALSFEPLGAQLDLGGGFLGGDVERFAALVGEVRQSHRRQRRLADPGRAADQDQRTGHQAAPEHAVKLTDAGAQARVLRGGDVVERDGRGCAATGPLASSSGLAGCWTLDLFDERVPLAAAGALAGPAQAFVAAGGADVYGGCTGHTGS